MKKLVWILIPAFLVLVSYSCTKKDSTPTTPSSVRYYAVAISTYSLQAKYLFIYTDINGTHTDTVYNQTDSILTEVESGSQLQVLQKIQCLDTNLSDVLTIHAYMNGGSVSSTKSKAGSGPLVVGVELQSLQQ